MLISDLGKAAEQTQSATNGLLHISIMSETVTQTLLAKGVFTEDDLKETHRKVSVATREKLNEARIQDNEESSNE